MALRLHNTVLKNNQPVPEKPKYFNIGLFISSVVLILIVANMWIFALSVQLTDSMTRLEAKTTELKKSNEILHTKIYAQSSYEVLTYTALDMGFTQEAKPYSLDNADLASIR